MLCVCIYKSTCFFFQHLHVSPLFVNIHSICFIFLYITIYMYVLCLFVYNMLCAPYSAITRALNSQRRCAMISDHTFIVWKKSPRNARAFPCKCILFVNTHFSLSLKTRFFFFLGDSLATRMKCVYNSLRVRYEVRKRISRTWTCTYTKCTACM